MYRSPINYLYNQSLKHYAFSKSFPRELTICIAKVPFKLSKAIHTSQVGSRDYVYKPYQPPHYEDHDHKNMRLKRPMSPHLTIYAPTLPAATSISQRISGIIVTFYALILSGGALFLSNGVDSIVSIIQSLNLNFFFIFIFKFLVALPFYYHYFCGIRFCLFAMSKMMDKASAYKSAKHAIIAAGVMSLLLALR